ncbi:hypothetical protein MPNT_60035 [Candidatus Methylacidithermus pantelleriae]|uniref:Uncharacterized protein n=1 Tax=Candidatus Methylacidithermus pantelleriae TaxID=2744239 RepID=A0A8J2BR12_9BACT|nr:hypothetical protein MPNT_60035 [Candidatus Methylacidithermus pantelleriae]
MSRSESLCVFFRKLVRDNSELSKRATFFGPVKKMAGDRMLLRFSSKRQVVPEKIFFSIP